ncbi:hypothetical protein G6L40_21840 [Rhizobium lusitanum]|uniref:hypothetical protein n=1 Tax=Rhizobium lusitanum TaxID=293958 RepID=UPI0013AF6508|nr:hypothetical protein [Rhizobium lusitanum]NTJ09646.1 hypothetical protein [Rhizobium lusitanum]
MSTKQQNNQDDDKQKTDTAQSPSAISTIAIVSAAAEQQEEDQDYLRTINSRDMGRLLGLASRFIGIRLLSIAQILQICDRAEHADTNAY